MKALTLGLLTLLAAVGVPDIKERLLKGYQIGTTSLLWYLGNTIRLGFKGGGRWSGSFGGGGSFGGYHGRGGSR